MVITKKFAYVYMGLVYFNIYKNDVFQFQGTEEDYQDYLELLGE